MPGAVDISTARKGVGVDWAAPGTQVGCGVGFSRRSTEKSGHRRIYTEAMAKDLTRAKSTPKMARPNSRFKNKHRLSSRRRDNRRREVESKDQSQNCHIFASDPLETSMGSSSAGRISCL